MQTQPTFKNSLYWPAAFVLLLWIIEVAEKTLEVSWGHLLGVLPRTWEGLNGILTFPLVHGDWGHLASNSLPLLVMGTAIFYFYRPVALRVIGIIYILHGVLVFTGARQVFHIGASGLVYGFAIFLLVSGILRKERSLMALSMLVIFLYGGMLWGVLPIREGVSWEGHLFGALAGLFCAFFYKHEGPQRQKYEWEEADELPDKGVWDYNAMFPPPEYPEDDDKNSEHSNRLSH